MAKIRRKGAAEKEVILLLMSHDCTTASSAGSCQHCIGKVCRSAQGRLRADTEPIQGRLRADTGQTQGKHRADSGQAQSRLRADTGQTRGRLRTDSTQTQGRHRADSGQTQSRLRADSGQTAVDRQGWPCTCLGQCARGHVCACCNLLLLCMQVSTQG